MIEKPKIRVMIVDDQKAIRYGFAMIINKAANCIVIEACVNGQEALAALTQRVSSGELLPEVIIMDIRMPVMDGIVATKEIKARYPHIQILALTTYDQDDYAFKMLSSGASGFLLKDVRGPQLIAAIEAIYAGDAVLTPRITGKLLARHVSNLTTSSDVQAARAQFDMLTEREIEVVTLVSAGLNNAEIAEKLYIEPDSAKKAVSRILTKLGMRDRVQLAIQWTKAGL